MVEQKLLRFLKPGLFNINNMVHLFSPQKNKQKGFGLVEVMIAACIITVGIVALISSYSIYIKYAFANMYNVQAAYIAEEGLEAVTWLRDNGWSAKIATLTAGSNYYLEFSNSIWKATTTPQYIDGMFLRKFVLSNVSRNGSGVIVTSGGTNDANTKLVTVTVDYRQGSATSTNTIATYITNLNAD